MKLSFDRQLFEWLNKISKTWPMCSRRETRQQYNDVFLSGTYHRGGSTTSGFSTSGDRGNNNNQTVSTMEFNKLPWIPLMKLDAQGWCCCLMHK